MRRRCHRVDRCGLRAPPSPMFGVVRCAVSPRQTGRPARTADGKPNFNGVWQALNEANWDLQAHEARPGMVTQKGVYDYEYARVPAAPVVALGAAAGVPGSIGVVQGDGQIPYKPEAADDQTAERRELDRSRSRAQVLSAGHSARDVHAVSVRDRSGHRQDSHDLRVLERGPRDPPEQSRRPSRRHLHGPLGRPLGERYAGRRGDELQREELVRPGREFPQRRAARWWSVTRRSVRDAIRYEVTIEDPKTFTQPWTIAMPLYRRLEANATVIDYPCIEFSEEFMYGHLRKTAAGQALGRRDDDRGHHPQDSAGRASSRMVRR